jgi:GH24 family phage-related lysozyme (muramidase)
VILHFYIYSMAKSNKTLIWLVVGGFALYLYLTGNNANAATNTTGAMISDTQLAQTIQYEQFSATAYPDGSNNGIQIYSIGYGHQIQPGESYLLTATITPDQGKQFLLNDMSAVLNIIGSSGIQFTQGQIDCLADFGYSAGVGALQKVIATYQSNGSDAAASEMLAYVYWHPTPGGPAVLNQTLVNRRNAEVNSWNS